MLQPARKSEACPRAGTQISPSTTQTRATHILSANIILPRRGQLDHQLIRSLSNLTIATKCPSSLLHRDNMRTSEQSFASTAGMRDEQYYNTSVKVSNCMIPDINTVVILINATTLLHKSTLNTNNFGSNHFGQKYPKQNILRIFRRL